MERGGSQHVSRVARLSRAVECVHKSIPDPFSELRGEFGCSLMASSHFATYSERSTATGSTRLARRVGKNAAAAATASISDGAPMKVSGS